ncbi:MAG: starch-binding protein [Acetatifactor sp.]|nr:starch-binding protein [Acetatifactor sp.]
MGNKFTKRLLAVALGAIIALSPVGGSFTGANNLATVSAATSTNLPQDMSDGAILHAFCWSFNTIKNNMANIAAAGFSAVQTSPINACESSYSAMTLSGPSGCWYYHYQPTDWTIGNYQLGTRAQFKAMCDEADKYGIKIIVDVVPNHTASAKDHVSSNLKNAVGGQSKLYHSTGDTWISDYSNRLQCTRYSLSGLPDVDTENTAFQNYFISYLNDCIACGADGFRYDTAKHIGLPDDSRPSGVNNNFWGRVTTEISNASRIFNYGEVLQGGNERLGAYQKAIGATTASSYGEQIRTALKNKNFLVSNIMYYCIPSDANADDLVTWVESHDNYINDGTWSELSESQVLLGYAIITARADGTPLFFSRPKGSSTSNMWGNNTIGAVGSDAYKSATVREVNLFRNNMVGQSEYLRNPNGSERILMIERGNKGMTIVNNSQWNYVLTNITTNLADGTYVDHISGTNTFTVSGGKINGTIPENGVVVLYNTSASNSGSNSGNSNSTTVYFYNSSNWSQVYAYVWGPGELLGKWPGTKCTADGSKWYKITLPSKPASNLHVIFNNGGNGSQSPDYVISNSTNVYMKNSSSSKYTSKSAAGY